MIACAHCHTPYGKHDEKCPSCGAFEAVHIIDPRTTRRRVLIRDYARNSALWGTFERIGTEGEWVVLQRKPEFCTVA